MMNSSMAHAGLFENPVYTCNDRHYASPAGN